MAQAQATDCIMSSRSTRSVDLGSAAPTGIPFRNIGEVCETGIEDSDDLEIAPAKVTAGVSSLELFVEALRSETQEHSQWLLARLRKGVPMEDLLATVSASRYHITSHEILMHDPSETTSVSVEKSITIQISTRQIND